MTRITISLIDPAKNGIKWNTHKIAAWQQFASAWDVIDGCNDAALFSKDILGLL